MTPALSSFAENLNEFRLYQTLGVSEPGQKLSNHLAYNAPLEYEIQNQDKEIIGMAQEEKKEGMAPFWIKNYYLGKNRAIALKITNENYEPILYLKRSPYILASNTLIYDERHELFASIKRRFHPFIRKYEFRKKNHELTALIHAPVIKPWTFPICNPRKREIGKIKKLFPTTGEFLTYRETLNVQANHLSPAERIMALSASLVLSIEHFSAR
ncbi:MAG: phospholipid scramblase-related protein [Oligoflexia bacterium]|nr:phospholipid scramblase-related protein [Oligoflexia bacterium]